MTRFYLIDIARKMDCVAFMASKSKGFCFLTRLETQRNNPTTSQVAAVDSIKALGNNSFHSLIIILRSQGLHEMHI